MEKKIVFILIALILIPLTVKFLEADPPNFIIDGDTVIYENIFGKIEVYPHTSTSLIHQTQFINLTWKFTEDDLDFAIQIDAGADILNKKSISLWKNISHPNEQPIIINVTNHLDCAGTQNVNFGTLNSTWGWCNDSRFASLENNSLYYYEHIFDSFNVNGSGVRFFFNETGIEYTDKWYFDYAPIGQSFNKKILGGSNYYFIQNVHFQQGETKNIKLEYDIPPNTNGKWSLIIKRSSDTLSQAFSNGHFVVIDPWFNSTYTRKLEIIIQENTGVDQMNTQVRINLSKKSAMNADWSDLIFVNNTENSTIDFYIVNTTNDYALIDTDLNLTADENNSIFAYFGNSDDLISDSNGTNTYLIFFDNFESETPGLGVPTNWGDRQGTGRINVSGTTANSYEGNNFMYLDDNSDSASHAVGINATENYTQGRYMFWYKNISGVNSQRATLWNASNLKDVSTVCFDLSLNNQSGYQEGQIQWNETFARGILDGINGAFFAKVGGCGAFSFESITTAVSNYSYDVIAFANWSFPEPTIFFGDEIDFDSTKPNVTIVVPTSGQTFTSRTFEINATIEDIQGATSCIYNITRGASTEISSVSLNCSQFNSSVTVSSDADYILHVFAEDETGNSNLTNVSFSVDTSGSGSSSSSSGGGGGASAIQEDSTPQERLQLCDASLPPLQEAWRNFTIQVKDNGLFNKETWEQFKIVWRSYFDYTLCEASASIIPLQNSTN